MTKTISKIILVVLSIILFALALRHNVDVFLADYYFRQARLAGLNNTLPTVLEKYKKVLWYQPFEQFYQRQFVLDLLWEARDFTEDKQTKIDLLNLAIERMNSIPQYDRIFETDVYLARTLFFKASLTQSDTDFNTAEQAMTYIAQRSPNMARVYNEWCQLKIYKAEWDEAEEMCKYALSLYPALNHPNLIANENHQKLVMAEMNEVYEKLGDIYRLQGKYQTAEEMYMQSLKLMPLGRPAVWKKIGDLYYLQGDIDTAIEKNLHGYHLNPSDPAWSRALMALYVEKGDIETAQLWQEKAQALD
ncbi:hypothetical protein MYX06_05310 [Patescibacteria group bacterium AH-259-L05]|nr:hypothetical protein [Patescibacteria group bacterium AH-259-L05]